MVPRLVINPALRHAIDDAVEQRDLTKHTLSVIAGYTHYTSFYETFRDGVVPDTPQSVERVRRIASAVGFDGPVFLQDGK